MRSLPLHKPVAVIAALGLSLSLAACGSDESSPSSSKSAAPQKTAAGQQIDAVWPLTGETVNGPLPKRPVLVVKIDNAPESKPQSGLHKADLVTEELVEGGITRLAVAFFSQLPESAGPVRSLRASDIGIIKPTKGVVVSSGGAPPTLARFQQAGVKYLEGGAGYYRDGSHVAPHNLFVKLPDIASTLTRTGTPDNYLPWGKDSDWAGKGAATKISATFSRSHTTNWSFQGGKYLNLNSNAASDQQFRPDTVLVLRVKVGDAGYRDPAGNTVPETIYQGTGQLIMFHNGQFVRGTWHKDQLGSVLKLRTAAGELKVPAGKTWIELVPQSGGNVTFGR